MEKWYWLKLAMEVCWTQPEKCAGDIISSLNSDVANNSQSFITQMTSCRASIGNSFAGVKEDLKGISANIIVGLNEGMNSKFGEVVTTAMNIAKNVSQSVRSTLGIHSPLRVMKELGVYTIQGFQNESLPHWSNLARILQKHRPWIYQACTAVIRRTSWKLVRTWQ